MGTFGDLVETPKGERLDALGRGRIYYDITWPWEVGDNDAQ